MIARPARGGGADGGWCRRRSSKPFRGVRNVLGGFDSHTLPCIGLAIVTCLVLGSPAPVAAQEEEAAVPTAEDADRSPVIVESGAETADSVDTGPAPVAALFKSMLLPGWGQFSADQPKRGVFYATAQAATVYMIIRTQRRINRADENGDEGLAESRREQREDWIALAVFWSLASGVDAWISAHMWGFAGEVVPPPDGSVGLAVQYSIPVPGF